jgi:hypothetical protein
VVAAGTGTVVGTVVDCCGCFFAVVVGATDVVVSPAIVVVVDFASVVVVV